MSTMTPLDERAPEPKPPEWLTVRQVADLWNLHQNTVYRYLRDDKLPCRTMRLGGRTWRINGDDARAAFAVDHFLVGDHEGESS